MDWVHLSRKFYRKIRYYRKARKEAVGDGLGVAVEKKNGEMLWKDDAGLRLRSGGEG